MRLHLLAPIAGAFCSRWLRSHVRRSACLRRDRPERAPFNRAPQSQYESRRSRRQCVNAGDRSGTRCQRRRQRSHRTHTRTRIPSALTDFKATLDPYGQWVRRRERTAPFGNPIAGVVGSDFQPYVTRGSLGLRQRRIHWMSDYDWGWAPFHYGRWAWIAGRGWCWIPGRTYAGAWVSWRTGGRVTVTSVGDRSRRPGGGAAATRSGSVAPATRRTRFAGRAICSRTNLARSHRARSATSTSIARQHATRGTDGRTPAHPARRTGPPPSRFGITPPSHVPHSAPRERCAASRARSRMRTRARATAFGAHAPAQCAHPTSTRIRSSRSIGMRVRRPPRSSTAPALTTASRRNRIAQLSVRGSLRAQLLALRAAVARSYCGAHISFAYAAVAELSRAGVSGGGGFGMAAVTPHRRVDVQPLVRRAVRVRISLRRRWSLRRWWSRRRRSSLMRSRSRGLCRCSFPLALACAIQTGRDHDHEQQRPPTAQRSAASRSSSTRTRR